MAKKKTNEMQDDRNWAKDFADGGKNEIQLGDEIANSMRTYIDYTLTDRALPYIDGLKPVHRAVLWYMWDNGHRNTNNYTKSQAIAGGVISKIHPHSSDAVYLAAAGLTRDKADDTRCGACQLNASLIDGHGNFGASFEDKPAAPRYTEMRLSKNGEACARDTGIGAVFMNPTFDAKGKVPEVMPVRIPLLLMNGSNGLAYGYNVSWLPHNPTEAIQACIMRLDNPKCTASDIKTVMPGPDFPSGGILIDREEDGITAAYETGFGSASLTSRYNIIPASRGRHLIDFYETPYGVNRSGEKSIVASIGAFSDKHPECGITDVKNLSGGEHDCLIEVSIKSGINADAVAQALVNSSSGTMLTQTVSYRQSAVIGKFEKADIADATGRDGMLRLTNPKPQDINVLGYIDAFIDFRRACVYNACEHEKKKALEQKHLIDGMLTALLDIDEVIRVIRTSQNKDTAKNNLKKKFKLDNIQADYILAIPLARLTRSDKIKLEGNSKDLAAKAKKLEKIMSSDKNIRAEVRHQLEEELENQTVPRRTTIVSPKGKIIAKAGKETREQQTEALTIASYATGAPVSKKNENAISAASLSVSGTTNAYLNPDGKVYRDEKKRMGWIQKIEDLDLNATVLLIFEDGDSLRIPAHELPAKAAIAKKKCTGIIVIATGEELVSLTTDDGKVKVLQCSTLTKATECPVMTVSKDSKVMSARPYNPEHHFIFINTEGQLVHFPCSQVNSQGRTSAGMAGAKLPTGTKALFAGSLSENAMVVSSKGDDLKVTALADIRAMNRGTSGTKFHKVKKGEKIIMAVVRENPNGSRTKLPKKNAVLDNGTKLDGSIPTVTEQ